MRISLLAVHLNDPARAVPLGPAMLASALKKHLPEAVECRIVDLRLEQDIEESCKLVMADEPDYLGLSMYIWNVGKLLDIAQRIKNRFPKVKIFAGGPEAGAAVNKMGDGGCIDFILMGEGEDLTVATFKALLDGTLKSEAVGLRTASAPDLASLPSPFLDGTLDPASYPGLLWELSRGCIFKCDFCFESRGEHGVRRFPLERIREELKLFRSKKVEQLFILDPTFNCERQRAKEILRLMKKTAPEIYYFIEVRSEFIDAEMVRLFSGLNCSLQIGMQSADPKVLANVNRSMKPGDFQSKIELLHQAQITYGFDLIISLPGDSPEGFRQSFDFAMSMQPNHIDIFVLSVLPGTRLSERAASFGLEYMPDNPYRVLSTPQFSRAAIARAEEFSAAFELFYNTGKAVPWFSIILEALQMRPCEFFECFAAWLKSGDIYRSADIIEIQRRFLEHIFTGRLKRPLFASIASDIAAYFGHTSRIIEDCDDIPDSSIKGSYHLNPLSSFANFSHNPLELAQQIFSGVHDFHELEKLLPPKPCSTLLFMNDDGEIDIRFLSEDRLKFLQQARCGIDHLPKDVQLNRFACACIAEGILIERKEP